MPIEFPPALLQAALDHIVELTAQNAQFAASIANKQGEIAGTVGPAPGLQKAEDVNADLYDQYSTRLGYFESERRALNGVYPSPVVSAGDITDAATTRSGVLFPGSNKTLTPTRVDALDGIGGADGNNEAAQLTTEAAQIVILQGLLLINRPGDPAYTAWVASLSAQAALLQTQSTAIAMNESYGTGSSAYAQAQSELTYVLSLLPSPPVDDTTLSARAAAVTTRQTQVTARVAILVTDADPFYDARYLVLKGRVNLIVGTLARLVGAQSGIQTLTDVSALNTALIALYNGLV